MEVDPGFGSYISLFGRGLGFIGIYVQTNKVKFNALF